jgi:hypothetical protein
MPVRKGKRGKVLVAVPVDEADKGKNKGGRPSKLTPELCQKLEDLVAGWNPFEAVNFGRQISGITRRKIFLSFMGLSTKENVAFMLGITKNRLYDYDEGVAETYDPELVERFRNALKEWETKRDYYFMPMMEFFPSGPTWIFLAKNIKKFVDVVRVGNIPGEKLELEEARRRVQQTPLVDIARDIERAREKAGAKH